MGRKLFVCWKLPIAICLCFDHLENCIWSFRKTLTMRSGWKKRSQLKVWLNNFFFFVKKMFSIKMCDLLSFVFEIIKTKQHRCSSDKNWWEVHITFNYNGAVLYWTKLLFGMSASLPPLSFLGKTLLLLCQPLCFSDRLSERQLAGQRWRMKWIIYLSICAHVPHSSHPIYSAPCTQTPVKVTFLWRIINNFLNPCIAKFEQFGC